MGLLPSVFFKLNEPHSRCRYVQQQLSNMFLTLQNVNFAGPMLLHSSETVHRLNMTFIYANNIEFALCRSLGFFQVCLITNSEKVCKKTGHHDGWNRC